MDLMRKLGITVEATDKASGKLSNVKREVAGIDRAAMTSGSGWGRFVGGVERGASRMKASIGGAVSHAKKQLTSLATVGLAGLGIGGIFAIGTVLSDSISKSKEFGKTSINLSKVIAQNVTDTSRLVDALDYYGIGADKAMKIGGLYEKTVAKISSTSKTAAKFEKDYGLAVVDNRGKVLSFNQQLLASADFFNNKAIPAQAKAAALSKLYGRSWQDLIPLLSQGRAGIQKALDDAMHLSKQDIANAKANEEATRRWNDAVGDLETTIGIKLMPRLTKVLNGFSDFVDKHSDDIVNFFDNAATGAGKVVSAAGEVVGGLKSAWDSIPDPVKDLFIKGFVADRTVKFLFGFSPAGLAIKLGQEALGGIAGAVGKSVAGSVLAAGIGKAFVQPVFVTNAGFGGGGGGLPGPAAAGGGLANMIGGGIATAVVIEGVREGVNLFGDLGKVIDASKNGDQAAVLAALKDATDNTILIPKVLRDIGDWLIDQVPPKPAGPKSSANNSPDDRDNRSNMNKRHLAADPKAEAVKNAVDRTTAAIQDGTART
ncbi:MAG: hypothetical protein JO246_04535, partial [Frankiaceae bacterium]|nr:hypothetical protein [Frankiaceae bacterium]